MSPYSFTQAGTTYDAEDRLTGFALAATLGTPQLSQSWNLSAVGDWNSVTTNGTAQSRTHGPTHELLTAGGQGVTHDTKGNMLLIPASVRANSSPLVLTWDFDNRMVSADVGADSVIDVTHQYDALGRRVARTASGSTTVFVQVGQQTICDYTSGAVPASSTYRYLYASYIDEPIVRVTTSNSETTWYHRNQQYSIVACTDSTGAATERYAYTAYGLPTITDGSGTVRTSSAIGNRYTYTGREWDGTLGLYHYRARMYEATVGRFVAEIPLGMRQARRGCMNTATRNQVSLLIRGVNRLCHHNLYLFCPSRKLHHTVRRMCLLCRSRQNHQCFLILVFEYIEISFWISCLQCARSAPILVAEDQEGPINCHCIQTVMKTIAETML